MKPLQYHINIITSLSDTDAQFDFAEIVKGGMGMFTPSSKLPRLRGAAVSDF